ncbi:GRIP domain containing protein [Aphelenchoides avenae]|nr:GRIP domain containing protein [Aphelenchus avenae]
MSEDDPPGGKEDEAPPSEKTSATLITANVKTAPGAPTSKLDSLSKEDLMRLIRRQNTQLKEAKKQVEELRKSQTESDSKKVEVPVSATEMISLELKDYKASLDDARKRLGEAEAKLSEKDTLIQEISQKLDTVSEARENLNESLKQANSEISKLQKSLEEKNLIIAEHTKENQSLSLGSEQLRSALEDEISGLRANLREAKEELAAERKESMTKSSELRTAKDRCDLLETQLNDIKVEYESFKERAQYVLKQKGDERSSTRSEEVDELIKTLATRNEKIAALTDKCSFLEEDRQASKEHAKNLRAEVDDLNMELAKQRRLNDDAQRRLVRYEQTFKQNSTTIDQLNQQIARLRRQIQEEKDLLTESFNRQSIELAEQNRKLQEQLEALQALVVSEASATDTRRHKRSNQENGTLAQRQATKAPQLINFDQSLGHSDRILETRPDDVLVNDSDSDDLQSLRHMVNNMHDGDNNSTSTEDVNLATLQSSSRMSSVYVEDWEVLERQLRHTRELLNETEETNVKLMEQVSLLKEEIRRLERSQERAQHLANNEYFKNVMLKFLAPEMVNDERQQLLSVLKTMLRLTPEEEKQVRETLDETSKVAASNEWGGYFGPLAGIF